MQFFGACLRSELVPLAYIDVSGSWFLKRAMNLETSVLGLLQKKRSQLTCDTKVPGKQLPPWLGRKVFRWSV